MSVDKFLLLGLAACILANPAPQAAATSQNPIPSGLASSESSYVSAVESVESLYSSEFSAIGLTSFPAGATTSPDSSVPTSYLSSTEAFLSGEPTLPSTIQSYLATAQQGPASTTTFTDACGTYSIPVYLATAPAYVQVALSSYDSAIVTWFEAHSTDFSVDTSNTGTYTSYSNSFTTGSYSTFFPTGTCAGGASTGQSTAKKSAGSSSTVSASAAASTGKSGAASDKGGIGSSVVGLVCVLGVVAAL